MWDGFVWGVLAGTRVVIDWCGVGLYGLGLQELGLSLPLAAKLAQFAEYNEIDGTWRVRVLMAARIHAAAF